MWLSHHHEYFRLKSACDWLPIAQWKALSQKARASDQQRYSPNMYICLTALCST
uniref:Myosin heavy chain cardiac muscle isoform n=1 Tax=Rhizophora mucronata TaxID=61149 RepID=A0A2P2JG24_RHIMU